MKSVKKIAVLTSGGDAQGMNAAIREIVRPALNESKKILQGMMLSAWVNIIRTTNASITDKLEATPNAGVFTQ